MTTKTEVTYSVHYFDDELDRVCEYDFGFKHGTAAEAINRGIAELFDQDDEGGEIIIRKHIRKITRKT